MHIPLAGLFRAEWRKILHNPMLTGFLVWIFPVGLGAFYGMGLLLSLVSEKAHMAMVSTSSGSWTSDMLGIWTVITSFPINIFPRLLPLAFMAVGFAGEYQWGMWKNLAPRSRRRWLLLVKLVTLSVVVLLALALSSLIIGAGQALNHAAADAPYGPELSAEQLGDFLSDYAREATLGFISLLVLAGFAALAALLTRSILGGLLAGFGLSVLEPMSFVIFLVLGNLLDNPAVINLYRFAPSYNIDNIRAWLTVGTAYVPIAQGFSVEPTLAFSYLALAAWVLGLLLLAAWIFERQDITA